MNALHPLSFRAKLVHALAPLALAIPIVATLVATVDGTEEPPARFELTLDGKTIEVEAGSPFEFELGGKTHTGRLVALPRRLITPTLSFDYPAHMSFELEEGLDMSTWTLDGVDASVLLFNFGSDGMSFDELWPDQLEAFDPTGEVTPADTSIELDGESVSGKSITVGSDDSYLHAAVFPLGVNGSATDMITIIDIRDAPDVPTEEWTELLDLLSETFERVED